jgi:hypothetical protein
VKTEDGFQGMVDGFRHVSNLQFPQSLLPRLFQFTKTG